jgi:hypothetical protein
MLVNGNNNIITAPNIILERTSKRMSDFIDAADDSNNIKGNNNLMQALRVFDNLMEINGVYPYVKAFFPTVGGTAISHKFNFINPALYEITWTSAYIHSLSGVKHDGTTGSIATSSLTFADLTYNDTHLLFGELEILLSTGVGVGFQDTAGTLTVDRFLMHPRYTDGNHFSDHYSGVDNRISYVNDMSLGVYFTQRNSPTYAETRKNGIIKNTTSILSNGSPTGFLRIANINNDPSSPYTGLFSGIGVGSSMPNVQAIAYSNAVNVFLKMCSKK